MSGLSDAAREAIREAARRELERNPPPTASPELVAKLRAIFARAVPDMATAGPADPAAAKDHRPAPNEWKSDAHESNSAA